MKKDLYWGLVVVGIVVGMMLSASYDREQYERQIRDLELRLVSADEKVDTFFIHDSIPVAQVRVVEVDKTDYKAQLADKKLIKDLQLRIKEVESENRTLLSTRDTVVLNPLNDSVLTYSDKWNSFSYELKSRVLDWEVRDSLVTFVSSEYRHRFLWWKWGRKGYKMTIVNYNPRSRVEYNKYISVK
jgi:hypothetical protein